MFLKIMRWAILSLASVSWLAPYTTHAINIDPVLCMPGFMELARNHPNDWEQRIVNPSTKIMMQLQRLIGFSGLVIGYAEQYIPTQDGPVYFSITVIYWDGTDLFEKGLPREYNGKPIWLNFVTKIPRAFAETNETQTISLDNDIYPPECPQSRVSANYGKALDYEVENGWFYTQGASVPGYGFVVDDDGKAKLWSEFQRRGGVEGVGYPISQRFLWDSFVSQALQKMVFQWRPEEGQVYVVNVIDLMHERGLDEWLRMNRATPPIADWSSDAGRSWAEIVAVHQALLTDPDIRAAYFAVKDPITLYGLPMAPIQDLGNVLVLRAQRGIIQKWLVDTPWARAGQVTIANSGDLAKEAGLLPVDALIPRSP